MLAIVVHLAVASITGWLAFEAAYYVRKHPNRSRRAPRRLRFVKIVPIGGWTLLLASIPMILASDASRDDDRTAMAIASFAILGAGAFLLLIYRNWYVAFGDEEVEFRTLWGVTRTFRYSDIADYVLKSSDQGPVLSIRTTRGARFSLNIRMYDASPLLAQLQFHQATGRWAIRGELPGVVAIEDDGRGVSGSPGNGLQGMAERAAAAGAVLVVEDAATGGTRVSVTW